MYLCPFDNTQFDHFQSILEHLSRCKAGRNQRLFLCPQNLKFFSSSKNEIHNHIKNCECVSFQNKDEQILSVMITSESIANIIRIANKLEEEQTKQNDKQASKERPGAHKPETSCRKGLDVAQPPHPPKEINSQSTKETTEL